MIMKYSQFKALTMLVGIMGIGMASCMGANRTEKQSADSLVSGSCTTSKLLGYSNIHTTEIYADVVMDKKADAVNLMNGLFGKEQVQKSQRVR